MRTRVSYSVVAYDDDASSAHPLDSEGRVVLTRAAAAGVPSALLPSFTVLQAFDDNHAAIIFHRVAGV